MGKNSKSPLTGNPLRNPGQSLDEEIDNLITDKVVMYLMFIGYFIFITVFEWWRWYRKSPYTPVLFTIVSIPIISFSIFKLFKIYNQLKVLKLGRDGEKAVGQYLELLRENGCKIFHDIIGHNFNIDHVIICKSGIFTVETKTYSKPEKGMAKIQYDGEKVTINGHETLKDVITQAKAEAHWLRGQLREMTGKVVPIKPVVVFPGWFIENSAAGYNSEVWVLEPKALSGFLPNSGMNLTKDEIQLFSYHLSRYIRTKK